jgi:hypothetical protein
MAPSTGMTSVEQHKLVAALRDYEGRMTRDEQETFAMLRKRDKDDEDLDEASKRTLLALHEKYVLKPRPASNPLDALFRKPPAS